MFDVQGQRIVARSAAASPWLPDTLNGAALSALMATLSEQHAAAFSFLCTRMSLEFLRPVPDVPLTWRVHVVREGRRQQVLRLSLVDGERECAAATFVRLRVEHVQRQGDELAPAFEPTSGEPFLPAVTSGSPLSSWIDARLAPRRDLAHRSGWMRYQGEVIAGVPMSPFARMALFADFAHGLAPLVPPDRFTFLNAELTLHLARLPRGDWLHLDCRTIEGGHGLGMTRTVFADGLGDLGYAHQSLLFDRRD
jgi:hypothetical protein